MAEVRLQKVCKVFGKLTVLKDISLNKNNGR